MNCLSCYIQTQPYCSVLFVTRFVSSIVRVCFVNNASTGNATMLPSEILDIFLFSSFELDRNVVRVRE